MEATCTDSKDKPKIQNEIIEIGAVKLNEKLEEIERFQSFVKPFINPILTDFCKNLTSIQQNDVDNASTFDKVIKEFKNFIGNNYILCSWGFYDRNQLISDCILHKESDAWVKNHISLKHQHQDFNKLSKGVGLSKALHMDKLTFDGTKHRGIDDAVNIAKIFRKNFSKWKF